MWLDGKQAGHLFETGPSDSVPRPSLPIRRQQPVILSAESLRQLVGDVLEAVGVPADEAHRVADSLVEANLRGHESHGVVRIPDYLKQLQTGELAAGVELEILSETESILAADAGMGFGMVQCQRLIERLIPKARRQGIACGALRNCGHVGRLGEWVEIVAQQGLAALLTVNDNGVLQCVAPPGGTAPRISTNPLAIGVPTDAEPLVLDISTSAVANGKIKVAWLQGRKCPAGWLQDAEGNPTVDPAVRFTDPRGTILPMGGEQGYKGFGLGLFLDFLVGGLSGGFCPPAPEIAPGTNNVLLAVWDPDRFAGRSHFLGEVEKLTDYVRSTPRKAGIERIRLPGDRSRETRRERLAHGIPVDEETWGDLVQLATELGVPVPRGIE